MANPTISVVSVTDTASQVVSEPGRYRFLYQGPNTCWLGTSSITSSLPAASVLASVTSTASFEVELAADAELFAVCQSGLSTSLKVIRWF